ncbi:unnamed protein product [Diatraea saccharalis]|uniref:Proteasome assembly chaperone 1 n=1 Tax=Diatraea saccharalis TaxID=40085 RepID=A0A9N9R208_9NEOP|nr:unnamed protein product [Diatraea saccharalis]
MTTYGEIVEPVSRTAWEDWDDITFENSYIKLDWMLKTTVPDIINTLVLLEGKYLYDCVKNQSDNVLTMINSIKEVNLNVHKHQQLNLYICVIRDYNLLQSSEIVEILKPYILVSKNVVAIQTKPLIEFQTHELINKSCLIRTICSTKTSNLNFDYPKLQQPNFISGVSAGAICLREQLDLPGTAVVCYMEHPEVYKVEEIQKLLKELKVISNDNSGPDNVFNSNLYI